MMVNHAVRVSRSGRRTDMLRGGRSRREHVGRRASGRRLLVAGATRFGDLALEVVCLSAQDVGNVVPRRSVLVRGGTLLLVLVVWRQARRGGEVVRRRAGGPGSGRRVGCRG